MSRQFKPKQLTSGSFNISGSFSGSFSGDGSNVTGIISSSFASTASYLNTLNQDLAFNGNLTLNGTASISYLNVVYETASVIYSSGSNQFGDATSDIQTLIGQTNISGSLNVTGSANLPNITGSLFGTSSWALNAITASYALTASYVNPLRQDVTITGSLLLSASHISTADYIDFNPNLTAGVPTFNTGRLHWVDDTKTLGLDTDVNGSVIELGHQHVTRVVNLTNSTISKGRVVYITGSQGTRPGIATASYTDENDSATTLGLVMHDIVSSGGNSNGYVVTKGIIREVNTSGLSAGASLYLSSSGQYTTIKPQAPLHDVRLGKVIVGNSTNAGVIYVDIQNGYEIDELHNVRIIGDTSGDLIVKSGSLWINTKQLTGSYQLTGSLTATSFTGSLYGTASWAQHAISASYYNEQDPIFTAVSGTFATTASFNAFTSSYSIDSASFSSSIASLTAATSSYVLISQTSSMSVLTASFSATASYVQNAQTASYVLQAVSSSYASSASYYTETDPVFVAKSGSFATTGSNTFIGDQNITGSLFVHDVSNNVLNIDSQNRSLKDASGIGSVDWAARTLIDSTGTTTAVAWDYNQLYAFDGYVSVDWYYRTLKDNTDCISADWQQKQLYYPAAPGFEIPVLNWVGGELRAPAGGLTVNWFNRQLIGTGGTSVILNWATNPYFSGSLYGTASWSQNSITASFAQTASFSTLAQTASFATFAITASYIDGGFY
jgi:hypothetical protein